jgi:hypothetical protein
MRCGPLWRARRRAPGMLLLALSCLAIGLLLAFAAVAAAGSNSTVRVQYEDTMDEVHATEATEVEIKAAFLLRFPDFVSWPITPVDTLYIGVSGDDALLEMLALLAEQENQLRLSAPYVVKVLRVTGPDSARRCQILVLGDVAAQDSLQTFIGTHPAGTLTVGVWGEPRDGAIIRLFRDGDRVRFDISQVLAKEAGLRISSKLLNLARPQSDGGEQ